MVKAAEPSLSTYSFNFTNFTYRILRITPNSARMTSFTWIMLYAYNIVMDGMSVACSLGGNNMNELAAITEEQRAKLLNTRRRVVESIGKNMDLYGITLSIGHLYGNMYFNQEPVTLDEMSETMGMSKTSMSTGMRTLHDLKMINKVWGKGSRKDLYEVEPDWHRNFTDFFTIKWRKAVEQNMNVMQRSLKDIAVMMEQYEADEAFMKLLVNDKSKIEDALSYYRWLDRLIDSFESGEIYNFIPKEQ